MQTTQLDSGATWRCDTIEVWQKGELLSFEAIVQSWERDGCFEALKKGAHLVLTGGEPLLYDTVLAQFLVYLKRRLASSVFVELETNATRVPSACLAQEISCFNVSPKLSNSGMPKARRWNAEALEWFSKQARAHFKFVVSNSADIQEVQDDFVRPWKLHAHAIFLMPAVTTRDAWYRCASEVVSWCKDYGYSFSPRLQVMLWDETTGC